MPTGIYKRSESELIRLRTQGIGKIHSRESVEKRASKLRGRPSWNFKGNKIDRSKYPNMGTIGKTFKKNTPCKRMKATEETKRRLRESHGGSNHRNWKGGITSIGKRIRRLPEYFNWRIAVYKKHSYICQSCGKKGRHADHIKPFSLILKEFLLSYNQFSPIDDVDTLVRLSISHNPFWDIGNGQVLCKSCNCSNGNIFHERQKCPHV